MEAIPGRMSTAQLKEWNSLGTESANLNSQLVDLKNFNIENINQFVEEQLNRATQDLSAGQINLVKRIKQKKTYQNRPDIVAEIAKSMKNPKVASWWKKNINKFQ